MNNNRRKRISTIIEALEILETECQMVLDEENDCLDNIPENLEGSDRYCKMEDAVDNLDDALSSLQDAISSLNEAKE